MAAARWNACIAPVAAVAAAVEMCVRVVGVARFPR
jgi:hypothetical protein